MKARNRIMSRSYPWPLFQAEMRELRLEELKTGDCDNRYGVCFLSCRKKVTIREGDSIPVERGGKDESRNLGHRAADAE